MLDIDNIYPDDSGLAFDNMIEGMDSLFIVKSENIRKLADQLATYHNFTGRVAYHWDDNSGIKRFDLQHIILPKTERLIDALYHIGNMPHFGIFLFTGFGNQLEAPMMKNVIEHFIESTAQHRKFILFADSNPKIPNDLKDKFQTLTINQTYSSCESAIRTRYLPS